MITILLNVGDTLYLIFIDKMMVQIYYQNEKGKMRGRFKRIALMDLAELQDP
jgi:hypothetical protein